MDYHNFLTGAQTPCSCRIWLAAGLSPQEACSLTLAKKNGGKHPPWRKISAEANEGRGGRTPDVPSETAQPAGRQHDDDKERAAEYSRRKKETDRTSGEKHLPRTNMMTNKDLPRTLAATLRQLSLKARPAARNTLVARTRAAAARRAQTPRAQSIVSS